MRTRVTGSQIRMDRIWMAIDRSRSDKTQGWVLQSPHQTIGLPTEHVINTRNPGDAHSASAAEGWRSIRHIQGHTLFNTRLQASHLFTSKNI